jgi:hypothetical protein
MISGGERGGARATRKHTEPQIIEVLKQVEAGRTVAVEFLQLPNRWYTGSSRSAN